MTSMVDVSAIRNVYSLITQHIVSKVVALAVELKLDKDLLQYGSQTVASLAQKYHFNKSALFRFLRVLDAYGIVDLREEHVFPGPLCEALVHIRSPHLVNGHAVMHYLRDALETNQECYSKAFGKTFYEWASDHPSQKEDLLHWANLSASQWLIPAVLSAYDFSKKGRICSFGEFTDLVDVLKKQYGLYSTLVSKDIILSSKAERGQLKSYDLYLFCRTLLNHSDDQILSFIHGCEQWMEEGTYLLIIDFFLPDKEDPQYPLCVAADLNILTCLNGRLRSQKKWQYLVKQSNLVLKTFRVISDASSKYSTVLPLFILEAVKNKKVKHV